MITLHILQYSYNIMTSLATVCCCVDSINCTAVDGWKKCTEGMAVATELYRNGATVAQSGVQYSDRLLFYFRHKLLDTKLSVTSHTVKIE